MSLSRCLRCHRAASEDTLTQTLGLCHLCVTVAPDSANSEDPLPAAQTPASKEADGEVYGDLITACRLMAQSDRSVARALREIERAIELLAGITQDEHAVPERHVAAGMALAVAQYVSSKAIATNAAFVDVLLARRRT